ncbi:unnamed protein product, partial [Callosobruchus maculatus]
YLSQETSNNVVNDGYGVEELRDLTSNDYHLEDISNNVVNQKTSNLENMFIPNLESDGSPSEFTEREANEDCLIITAVKKIADTQDCTDKEIEEYEIENMEDDIGNTDENRNEHMEIDTTEEIEENEVEGNENE